ncbi:elongation factor P--(R)-beta-lysine ligase [bacterium endosymbiont of Pedicinus badii]|uniref:elongation factor P--(R)-beta-lysine ligase n=1 Tax=bacterium endosymbiont of Pedicinus badii TaxID=1719126 RepID=UPI0009BC450C|nr:elongation factor P--(R)-beta-lysine ligase [bacterium endosymbiont of Pedicinus badii]OQM34173.1 hypothetical protein AOQ89_02435 [bacterium endosymbiont of Pedicinus badii]
MKNKSWNSSVDLKTLKKRSFIIQKIRKFFFERKVLEVETPILAENCSMDRNIIHFRTNLLNLYGKKKTMYLMSSPEFHMKRIIAQIKVSIFQICKSFRNQEIGKIHNPEFTMLEWYRVGYTIFDLMKEIKDLLKIFFSFFKEKKISYRSVFLKYFQIDPFLVKKKKLVRIIKKYNLFHKIHELNKNSLLEIIFSFLIVPKISKDCFTFIYHFPSYIFSLAKNNEKNKNISERFELYFRGIELANGFFELQDYKEQYYRFLQENQNRKKEKLKIIKIDKKFLRSLKFGIPSCSGVALGLDRLIMIILKKKNIKKVISFCIDKA